MAGASDGCGESLEDEYAHLESEANRQALFADYIKSDVLANEKIIRTILVSCLACLGVEDI